MGRAARAGPQPARNNAGEGSPLWPAKPLKPAPHNSWPVWAVDGTGWSVTRKNLHLICAVLSHHQPFSLQFLKSEALSLCRDSSTASRPPLRTVVLHREHHQLCQRNVKDWVLQPSQTSCFYTSCVSNKSWYFSGVLILVILIGRNW